MDRKGGKEKNLMLIELLQVALGIRNSLSRIPSDEEWDNVYKLSVSHGVVGVLYGGIERLPKEQRPPKELLLEWFGQAECYRRMYERQRKAVESLNELWRAEGLKVFELKGDTIGRFYPRPDLRFSCDYDCLLSDYEQGNRLVEKKGVEINRDFYKNSSFVWKGLHVENHQFCTPVRGNRAMKRLETVLRRLVAENNTVDFNALFLMEHLWSHFFEDALTLKQLTDWVVFYKEFNNVVDWQLFEKQAKDCGFWRFSIAINKITRNILSSSLMSDLSASERRLWQSIMNGGGSIEMNNGWKTRMQLVRNYFRNGWRYRYYAPHGSMYALLRTGIGYVFDRNPKL
ncbi:nucleotidyltransferase family protein [bacterium]|nr:nucleotidyltransferase family protein [bacterium]